MDYRKLRAFIYTNPKLGSYKDLALFLGTSRQNISGKLKEGKGFTTEQMLKIKKGFNLSNDDLIELFFTE